MRCKVEGAGSTMVSPKEGELGEVFIKNRRQEFYNLDLRARKTNPSYHFTRLFLPTTRWEKMSHDSKSRGEFVRFPQHQVAQ